MTCGRVGHCSPRGSRSGNEGFSARSSLGQIRPEIECAARPNAGRRLRGVAGARRIARWALIAAFAAPTVLSALYYGCWRRRATNPRPEFLVRGVHGSRAAPGLEGLMQAFGIARSSDDTNVVLDYLASRDAVTQLEPALPLRRFFGARRRTRCRASPGRCSATVSSGSTRIAATGSKLSPTPTPASSRSGRRRSGRKTRGRSPDSCCRRRSCWSTG